MKAKSLREGLNWEMGFELGLKERTENSCALWIWEGKGVPDKAGLEKWGRHLREQEAVPLLISS